MPEPPPFTVLVDSREKDPYQFDDARVVALKAADYSIDGHADEVGIERKSKADLFSSVGRERGRFRRECERLSGYKYAAIVVEASLGDLYKPAPFSAMNPRAVVETMLSWSVAFRLAIFFAGDRYYGHIVTASLLGHYWRHAGANAASASSDPGSVSAPAPWSSPENTLDTLLDGGVV